MGACANFVFIAAGIYSRWHAPLLETEGRPARNQPAGWVAEIPLLEGCYALMPTRQEALAELDQVFDMIAAEYRERGLAMPTDTTEIVHA